VLGAFDDLDKARGIHCAAGRIEKDFPGRRVSNEKIEALRDYLAHLAIGIAAAAFQEFGSNGIGMLVSGLANVIEEQLHRTLSMECSTEQ